MKFVEAGGSFLSSVCWDLPPEHVGDIGLVESRVEGLSSHNGTTCRHHGFSILNMTSRENAVDFEHGNAQVKRVDYPVHDDPDSPIVHTVAKSHPITRT